MRITASSTDIPCGHLALVAEALPPGGQVALGKLRAPGDPHVEPVQAREHPGHGDDRADDAEEDDHVGATGGLLGVGEPRADPDPAERDHGPHRERRPGPSPRPRSRAAAPLTGRCRLSCSSMRSRVRKGALRQEALWLGHSPTDRVIGTCRVTEPEPYTQPAVAGSGTIACALAASASVLGKCPAAGPQRRLGGRAEERAQEECAKVEGATPERIEVTTEPGRSRPRATSSSRRWWRSSTPRPSCSARLGRGLPERGPGEHYVLALDCRAGGSLRPSAPAVRPPRLQPRPPDGADRGLSAGRAAARESGSEPAPGAARSARRRSRFPISRGSSSTASCSPTCSTPFGWPSEPGWRAPRSTPASSSARGTPWGRSGCWTSSGSTWPPRSARACSPTPERSATGLRG